MIYMGLILHTLWILPKVTIISAQNEVGKHNPSKKKSLVSTTA